MRLCDAMKVLSVSFKQLDYQISNKDLFKAVYRNSLYEINANNIQLMLEVEYHIENNEELLKKCISFVFSEPEEPLCKYVQDNMDLFLESILGTQQTEFSDSCADAVMIINDINISERHKVAYIARLKTLIEKLTEINEIEYQTELIAGKKVRYTVENILEYFGKMGITDDLAGFINSGSSVLDYTVIGDNALINDFWNKCISCEKISLEKYREILLSISPDYSEFTIAGISNDQMKVLIEEKFIPMTETTLIFMREKYKDVNMDYIIANLSQYVDIAKGNMASAKEVINILSYDIIDEMKIKLLSEIEEEISVVNHNYSDAVLVHILKHNLDETDLSKLFQNYTNYGLEVQHEILVIAKNKIDQITNAPQNVNRVIIMELLKETSIDINRRVNLFVSLISNVGEITNDECKQYLEPLEMPEFVKIFEYNRRPRIQINPINQKILNSLKEAGFIDSFVEDEEEKVYKQIRRRTVRTE